MTKAARPDKKPFKGKKKVKNVLEKKAKGLKLNKIDRKKVVKMEEKIKLQKQLKDKVRSQLESLDHVKEEEDSVDSAFSESTFGSSMPTAKSKKKVSFSGNLELTKVFDKNVKDLDIRPSEASPGKGILRVKAGKLAKKTVKMEVKEEKKPEVKKTKSLKRSAPAADDHEEPNNNGNKENAPSSSSSSNSEPLKKKKKIQITRKDKERLLALPRKERKAFLRELKEKANPLAKTAFEAKELWEKVRSAKTAQTEKDEAVTKLVGLVKGHASQFIYAHDTSRVIETLVTLGRQGITDMLFNELSSEIIRMAKSKYARFFVIKMLKVGNQHQRNVIINAFNGHVVALMRIVHAAEVVELAYNDYADQYQRYNIVSEFYGKEFILFRSGTPRTLSEIFAAEPAKRKLILASMEEQLQILLEKVTVRHSLTHKLLLDFLSLCDKDQFANMVDSMKDKIPEILHTNDGSYAAMKIIWNCSVKDRKLIVKNFKDLAVKAALEHYGHRVLNAIFDTVDDTVLLNKYIISELNNAMGQLILDTWGEKVIHYLVHPRDSRSMDKVEIKRLEEGDSNLHSKKDKKDRYAEMFKAIQENLYSYLSANMEQLIYEHRKLKFVAACLETTGQYDLFDRVVPSEHRQACNKAIVKICQDQEFIPMDSERLHMIEHPDGGFILNAVMRCDTALPAEDKLSMTIVNEMKPREYGSWIACNKGCHLLLKMCQVGGLAVKESIKAAVNWKQLQSYTFKGALLLYDHLK